jgi:Mrp family chromosome partitioning ATPase
MRVKLLIATGDSDYAGHLSENISELHADAIDVSVCQTPERLREMLAAQRFDAALIEAPFIEHADLKSIRLPLQLWSDDEESEGAPSTLKKMRKYQRISTIVTNVLEHYAKVAGDGRGTGCEKAHTTAVWSPAGGVGKTTVALAYAARKAAEGKQVLYLNLEPFSSIPAYFSETGKSISTVFEMLDGHEGNIKMLIRGIRQQDSGAGFSYLCRPDNFDDMYILSAENISMLIESCAEVSDELVIDMSCVCDMRTRRVFDLADRVLLVTDQTSTAEIKLSQFTSQHNVFERIMEKSVLIANKGAASGDPPVEKAIRLPLVQSANAPDVYRALSENSFEA